MYAILLSTFIVGEFSYTFVVYKLGPFLTDEVGLCREGKRKRRRFSE